MIGPRFGVLCGLLCGLWSGLVGSVRAADVTVWRCPGPPAHYTDRLPDDPVRAASCSPLQSVPLVIRPARRTATDGTVGASGPSTNRTPEQQERDARAVRILEAELRREEDRLAALQERPGDATATQRRRIESDIESIRRELARRR